MPSINESRLLIMATHGFEHSELVQPLQQLKAKGAEVDVAAPGAGQIKSWKDGNWAEPVDVDLTLDQVTVGDYDALVLPGGVMNPDKLRIDDKAVALVKAFVEIGEGGCRHLPWPVAANRGWRGQRPRGDVLPLGPHRPDECGRPLGRQAGGDRPGGHYLAPSR